MKTIQKILVILILQLFCIQPNIYAQDAKPIVKSAPSTAKSKFSSDPMKATMMAVAFPGLGQIYNKKIWKIPLVYAGFGGLIYSVSFNSSNYIKYMKAYQDFTDAIPATNSYIKLIGANPDTYDPVNFPKTAIPSNTAYFKDGMLRMVDYYKRYRDLSYIGIAAWYLVSILDANVDASLINYDVSNNLDITLFPAHVPLPGGFLGAGINVGMRITF